MYIVNDSPEILCPSTIIEAIRLIMYFSKVKKENLLVNNLSRIYTVSFTKEISCDIMTSICVLRKIYKTFHYFTFTHNLSLSCSLSHEFEYKLININSKSSNNSFYFCALYLSSNVHL